MTSPAESLFESLSSWKTLEALVEQGECEGPYLECKAPTAPQFTADLKAKLAVSVSGFANSGGGVVIWGMRTTRNGELDVLTEPTPLGAAALFQKRVEDALPRLAYPSPTGIRLKTLVPEQSASRGAIIAVIPGTTGDPVQSLIDRKFWLRTGSSFAEMPYEVVKRMFLGTAGPEVVPVFRSDDMTLADESIWRIPIVLRNDSSAIAESVVIVAFVTNPKDFDSVKTEGGRFRDISSINRDRTSFQMDVPAALHRGLPLHVGELRLKPRDAQTTARIGLSVFANRMRARIARAEISASEGAFNVKELGVEFMY